MKKILLLSDTHGFLDAQILKHVKKADEVWHAGDIGSLELATKLSSYKPLRAVYGNIDGREIRQVYPMDLHFELEGVSVWMTHIGGAPYKYGARIRKELQENAPKLFVCGHSHILKVHYDSKHEMLCMNPGAAGKHGFHQVRTLLRFELSAGNVKNLAVIELGKRS